MENDIWKQTLERTTAHGCKECLHRGTKERLLLQPLFVILGLFQDRFFFFLPDATAAVADIHAIRPPPTPSGRTAGSSSHSRR